MRRRRRCIIYIIWTVIIIKFIYDTCYKFNRYILFENEERIFLIFENIPQQENLNYNYFDQVINFNLIFWIFLQIWKIIKFCTYCSRQKYNKKTVTGNNYTFSEIEFNSLIENSKTYEKYITKIIIFHYNLSKILLSG